MCFLGRGSHITNLVKCVPLTRKHIFLVICVPLILMRQNKMIYYQKRGLGKSILGIWVFKL